MKLNYRSDTAKLEFAQLLYYKLVKYKLITLSTLNTGELLG